MSTINNHTIIYEAFLQIVKLGIGARAVSSFKFQDSINWEAVKELAEKQGLSAVVLDGIEKLPEQLRPSKVFLLEWIGETLRGYEYRYDLYCRAIAELDSFYNSHGYKMMVLKGYACSLDWPKPEHRPCGDIDIWLFGRHKEADAALVNEKSIEIDYSHHHHTVFLWGEFMVENHYDFDNIHARKSNAKIEVLFKELAQDESHFVELKREKIYLPSPNLHALFLMRHLVSHFVGACISLRLVLDWAFFVEKHSKDVDWNWLDGVLEEFGMKEFYNIINAICVEDLGFDVDIFKGVQFDPQIKDRVFNDILCPAFEADTHRLFLARVIYKYKRWKGNAWKHDMCYGEGRWESFWTLLKSHLMKPEV